MFFKGDKIEVLWSEVGPSLANQTRFILQHRLLPVSGSSTCRTLGAQMMYTISMLEATGAVELNKTGL